MRRAFFCVVWSGVFVFLAALAVSMTAALGAGDDPQARDRAARQAGEDWGVPTVFGSIALAVVLGASGVLPGTSRRAPADAEAEGRAAPTLAPPPCRPSAPLHTQLAPSEHVFTLGGFLSRWDRRIGAVPVFLGFGLFVTGTAPNSEAALVGVLISLIGLVPLLLLLKRFLGMRWVRLDSGGVAWGGLFGAHHREWGQVVVVNREELILNRRHYTSVVRLEFAGGGSVSFDQALTDYDTLAGTIQAVTCELLLPQKWGELQREGEVRFGQVKLRPDGIQMKGRFFSWDGLGRCRIENGHLVLYARIRPRAGGDKGVPLSAIPNYPVLLSMMKDGGAPI